MDDHVEDTSLADASSVGGIVELAGKKYQTSKFTVKDAAAIQQWLRSRIPSPMSRIKDQLEGFSERQQDVILAAAVAQEANWRGPTKEQCEKELESPDGVAFLLYIMIKGNHPDVQLEHLEHAVASAEIDLPKLKRQLDGAQKLVNPTSLDQGQEQQEENEPTGSTSIVSSLSEDSVSKP